MPYRPALLALLIACTGSDPEPGGDGPTDGVEETSDTAATETDTESDTGPTSDTETTDSETTTDEPATDFRLAGPYAVSEEAQSIEVKGCTLRYDLFVPDGDTSAPLMVLGHGFQRAPRNMAGMARHIASHGVRVAVPAMCWDRLTGSDHPRNGSDAAALAEHLAPGAPVVYAGQSAGGLATAFAAAEDPDALAWMGLDAVDTDGSVVDALVDDLPRWALVGEPGACNDRVSIRPFLEDAGARVSALLGATHCDFELPTDGLCTALCGGTNGSADIVKTTLAAFASERHGLDPTARAWVDGVNWQELIDNGVAVELAPASPAW